MADVVGMAVTSVGRFGVVQRKIEEGGGIRWYDQAVVATSSCQQYWLES